MASLRTATSVHHSVCGRRSCDLASSSHLTVRPRRSFQAVHAFQSAEASQAQPAGTQQQQTAADSSSSANNNIDDNWWHYQRQVPWWQKRPVVLASGKCIAPRPKTREREGLSTWNDQSGLLTRGLRVKPSLGRRSRLPKLVPWPSPRVRHAQFAVMPVSTCSAIIATVAPRCKLLRPVLTASVC